MYMSPMHVHFTAVIVLWDNIVCSVSEQTVVWDQCICANCQLYTLCCKRPVFYSNGLLSRDRLDQKLLWPSSKVLRFAHNDNWDSPHGTRIISLYTIIT